MVRIPKDLFQKLEFDKILQILSEYCYGALGRRAVGEITPRTDVDWVRDRLKEVHEYATGLQQGERPPISAYENLNEELRYLEVPDYVLPLDGLQRIRNTLRLTAGLMAFFTPERQDGYPGLYQIVRTIPFDSGLQEAMDQVLDEEGEIRPDASPGLLRIRKGIISKQKELDRSFRQLVNTYRKHGWLTDNVESFRNGRRVLSVPAEHKRKIRGIIHDESTTGKTAFIEPEGVIDINNDIFDLQTEEKREIYRILKELCDTLRPYVSHIRTYQDLLVRFDLIQAKARLANAMEANRPRVLEKPHLGIVQGYHPLLFVHNKAKEKPTVPFDLQLFGANRILMLSGPNAGGKSITMKSVGLMQLMLQSGMLLPVREESEFGIFSKLFADIGDQQSIEQDLSTYSSRLENMRRFLKEADENTLLVIDEFGSGTDPQMGGAIAEAILRDLNRKRVYGLITTHYSNLKIFAFKTKGLVNGAMTFDKDTLSPTYELKIGKPGSSYAFEIATQVGLSTGIMNYARKRMGKSDQAVDELLVDLQRERQELSERLARLSGQEEKLDKLIKNYENMHRELEHRRKRQKLESREQQLQSAARENKELERLIREIREEKNLEKAKALASRVREERKELSEKVGELREEVFRPPSEKEAPIQVGDFVKMRSGGASGVVEALEKDKAIVQMGLMRMTVPLRDLRHAKAPLDVSDQRSVRTDTVTRTAGFESKIDIRGMRMEEAMRMVEEFVDQALMASATQLEIIHGKGSGVLRKAVHQKLREYDVEMDVRHPSPELGGDGVTLVDLA